jgi:hypothetical protein
MLRAILGSNSQLALPPKEYQFFDTPPVLGSNGAWAARPQETLAAILGWDKVREWGLPAQSAGALLDVPEPSPADIYAAPLRAYARMAGKPRFGEKTPYLERHFETLLDWFGPGMRFVQILRAPLPTYASHCFQGGSRQIVDPYRFAQRWRSSALRGLDFARRFPEQFLLIDYDAFTAEPDRWTQRLCEFCGLPPEIERMLAMRDFERKRNSSFGVDAPSGAEGGRVAPPSDVRHRAVSRLDRWIIRRELGILADGIAGLAENAALPLALVDAEKRGRSTVAARASVLRLRAAALLFQSA